MLHPVSDGKSWNSYIEVNRKLKSLFFVQVFVKILKKGNKELTFGF